MRARAIHPDGTEADIGPIIPDPGGGPAHYVVSEGNPADPWRPQAGDRIVLDGLPADAAVVVSFTFTE